MKQIGTSLIKTSEPDAPELWGEIQCDVIARNQSAGSMKLARHIPIPDCDSKAWRKTLHN